MKIARALVVAGICLAAFATPVVAEDIPGCVDVVDVDPSGSGQESRAAYFDNEVTAKLFLAEPSCRKAVYTLYVLDTSGEIIALQRVRNVSGEAFLEFELKGVATDDNEVCVYATTTIGKTLYDRAPDEGCVTLFQDGSPGSGSTFK